MVMITQKGTGAENGLRHEYGKACILNVPFSFLGRGISRGDTQYIYCPLSGAQMSRH